MLRKINISKYEGNTNYSIHVTDSFGQEHHLGYYKCLNHIEMGLIERHAEEIWSNEVKRPEVTLSPIDNVCEGNQSTPSLD